MKKKLFLLCCIIAISHYIFSQTTDSVRTANKVKDSITIANTEDKKGSAKVLHAEPLFIDLIRDLGARKGEKEWNIGFGMADNLSFDEIDMLIEYEFAPLNRLGLEIELPFVFYSPQKGTSKDSIPAGRLESLKLAGQWSFFVSEKANTSLAIGYIHEFTMSSFRNFGKPLFNGHIFNPFFIAAKRWGTNFHTLIYTGPRIEKHRSDHAEFVYDVNTNFHYMIPGTRNFIGVELNKNFHAGDFDMVVRPQMRLGIADNLLVGIVGGVPVKRENQRFSMFTRLIWEPGERKRKH
jgi:hypothetical protein